MKPASNNIRLSGLAAVYLVIFISIWTELPRHDSLFVPATMTTLLILLSAWLIRIAPALPAQAEDPWYFRGNTLWPDLLIILSPVALGLIADGGQRARYLATDSGLILLEYLPWAGIQMLLFLYLPSRVLHSAGYGPKAITLCCTVLFALVHWPNPLLVAFTGIAMWFWSRHYQAGRNLLTIVLVMAVAAAGMKITVPVSLSEELRIGPDYRAHLNIP